MPFDDRERSFENALARHLRPQGSQSECGDAETLAAFHEKSLEPEHMASVKAHVTDCARCQEILAQLQATDAIPVATTQLALPQSAATKQGVHVLPSRKAALWRWVAQAGAVAAALLVWVAVREITPLRLTKPVSTSETKPAEVAKAQPASPPSSVAPSLDATTSREAPAPNAYLAPGVDSRSQITALPPQRPSISREKELQSARKKSAEGLRGGVDDDKLGSTTAKSATAQDSLQSPLPEIPRPVTETVTVEPASPAAAPAQAARGDLAKSEPKAKSENEKRDAANSRAATLQPGVAAIAQAAPPAPAPPPPQSSQTVEVTAESAQAVIESTEIRNLPSQSRSVKNLTNLNQANQLLLASATGPVTVSAPDNRTSWRIGHAGVILFSSDAGKNWLVQPSGIVTDLLAGSAPSARVCWIVGRSGTILRTTDMGKHWRKVQPPTQDDFVSVFAVNDRQATVSPAAATYETTDGGATWHKLPPE